MTNEQKLRDALEMVCDYDQEMRHDRLRRLTDRERKVIDDALAAAPPVAQQDDAKDAVRYRFISKEGIVVFENGKKACAFPWEIERYVDRAIAAQEPK